MAIPITGQDLELLATIAEYRFLTAEQLADLHNRNLPALRRRLGKLADGGMLRVTVQGARQAIGRPRSLVSLAGPAVDRLKSGGRLPADIPASLVTAERLRCLEHDLLTNEFRVALVTMPRRVADICVDFLSATSPCLHGKPDGPVAIHERFQTPDAAATSIEFTPDGVFATSHLPTLRSVLFFLETDMGTETAVSNRPGQIDVRGKIANYQACFRHERYRRYEAHWNCRFRGFRVLFLTSRASRLAELSRLTREMPPSDFVWLTDHRRLRANGVEAPIWTAGGRSEEPDRSILGSLRP